MIEGDQIMERITTPLDTKQIVKLKAGNKVLLSGIIYTARDQVHKQLANAIIQKKRLPIDLKGQIIYYCGPTLKPKGKIIGSCGPTTSSRMDEFCPALLKAGLSAMIGKGRRSQEVVRAIRRYGAIYFLTYAGCGALLSCFIKKVELIGYPELGSEAICSLYVQEFPLIVGIDSYGNDIYNGSS